MARFSSGADTFGDHFSIRGLWTRKDELDQINVHWHGHDAKPLGEDFVTMQEWLAEKGYTFGYWQLSSIEALAQSIP